MLVLVEEACEDNHRKRAACVLGRATDVAAQERSRRPVAGEQLEHWFHSSSSSCAWSEMYPEQPRGGKGQAYT